MSVNSGFITWGFSFLLGVFFVNAVFDFRLSLTIFCVFSMMLFLLVLRVKKHHFFILLFILGLFFGNIYGSYSLFSLQNNISFLQSESNNYQQKVFITARVKQIYKPGKYTLQIEKINDVVLSKNISFLLNTEYKLNIGDIISLQTQVSPIQNFSSHFEYQRFLYTKNIYFQSHEYFEIIGKSELSKWRDIILSVRNLCITTIENMYPGDTSALLMGLLIGESSQFEKETIQNFQRSGLTHIVAVSGFNITIMIVFFSFIFGFLPIIIRGIIMSVILLFFMFIVGDSISVIRATFMGLIGYYIVMMGRQKENISILIGVALGIILFQPLSLNYDISFQLSFLAVLGIIYFQDFYKKIFSFLPKKFALQESLVLTFCALTTTLPIILFNFGHIPLLSPIANLLVGPAIPLTMLFGFISVIVNSVSEIGGYYIGYIGYFLLQYILGVAYSIGTISFATIPIKIGIWSVYAEIVYFLFLLFVILYPKKNEKS